MRYVIAYDIVDDRRRQRVSEFLAGWGRRVQKSVFECDLSREDLQQIIAGLRDRMDLAEDRCHIYGLCRDCLGRRRVFGSELEAQWAEAVIA